MLSGQRATAATNGVTSNQLVIDMEDKIHLLDSDQFPLAQMMSVSGAGDQGQFAKPGVSTGPALPRGTAYNPKHEWLEDELNPRTDAVNFTTAYSTIATTIVVDNGAYFIAGSIILDGATQEVMRVSSVSTNTLTVVRNLNADAAGFTISDNDPIVLLGDAESEGAAAPTANTTKTAAKFNYTQIFKRTVDITGTQQATKQYGGDDLINQRRKAGIDVLRDLEYSLFFGQRYIDTAGTTPLRAMGGVKFFVTSNITSASNAALTEATFLTWLRGVFDRSSGPLYVYCSPVVMDAISGFARGKLLTSVKDDTYGVALTKYVTPHGEVYLIREPVFAGATTAIGGYAVALTMENVQLLHLNGRGPKLRTNIQANDVDGEKDEFMTETTCALRLEKSHGILTNVAS